MQTLRAAIADFKKQGKAIGHFNISDSNQLHALAQASLETKLPVIVGLSEGEREFFPISHAKAIIDVYRSKGLQMYLNADHTYSVEKAKKAIDDGVDSIVVDGAKLSMEENIKFVREVVKYARSKKGMFGGGRDIVVEGELGYIGQSSSLHDELPEGVSLENLTTPEDAKKLVTAGGLDALAPAVGNVHGMLKSAAEPRLHPDRVKAIVDAVSVPLVLHGASGNTEQDIKDCIKAGIAVVHINTELRVLYRDSLRETLKGDETTPYKFLAPSVEAMKSYVAGKLKLFAGQ
ncbi:MAG TPA: class II fructose-bisphosphate aldolase [Candidatus Paceibacterota bacterium]